MCKTKFVTVPEKAEKIYETASCMFKGMEIDSTDGIKAIDDNCWIHIRKSGTEPIFRIYAESDNPDSSSRLCKDTLERLSQI